MVSQQTVFTYPYHQAKLQILLHGVTANSLYLSLSPSKATNLTTWCHCKQSLLILFTMQSYKSYYMVSLQIVFTYSYHQAKLQILLIYLLDSLTSRPLLNKNTVLLISEENNLNPNLSQMYLSLVVLRSDETQRLEVHPDHCRHHHHHHHHHHLV